MAQIPSDTRGIVAPGDLVRHVDFQRIPGPPQLAGLIDWFWSVRWDLPMGFTHRQRLVAHPAVNISVGTAPPPGENPPPGPYPLRAAVNGVTTTLTTRALSGAGWNIAAKTTVGGFGAWVDDVAILNDDVGPVQRYLGIDGAVLSTAVAGVGLDEAVTLIGDALLGVLEHRDRHRVSTAREVAEVASVADRDRSVRTVADLAAYAGATVRTLQRMFSAYAGVSPTWVIRRFRLIDAAELVREGQQVDWSAVSTELGYADQSHLIRDFTATIGQSPAAYAKAQRSD